MKAGIDDLNDDVLVGDTNNETVFGGVARQVMNSFGGATENPVHTICSWPVLQGASGHSLQMNEQAFKELPLIERTISLSLSPSAVLDLETREVGIGLDLFDERHLRY